MNPSKTVALFLLASFPLPGQSEPLTADAIVPAHGETPLSELYVSLNQRHILGQTNLVDGTSAVIRFSLDEAAPVEVAIDFKREIDISLYSVTLRRVGPRTTPAPAPRGDASGAASDPIPVPTP